MGELYLYLLLTGCDVDSAQTSAERRRSNGEVLHLAGEVTQMQSKVSSAASKLLQSADMVSEEISVLLTAF